MEKMNKINDSGWLAAWQASFPILFAYFPLGMVFGLVFEEHGVSWYLAPITSALIYGGSVQFLMLTMLDNGASSWAIVIAVFFVALRNLFYGLSFIDRYKQLNVFLKAFLSFGLVDATYATLLSKPNATHKFCFRLTLLIYLYWVLGTFVGALFADILPPIAGINFVLPAFFMVLVLDFYLIHRSWLPILLPVFVSILAYIVFPSGYLVIAISFCLIFLSMQYELARRRK